MDRTLVKSSEQEVYWIETCVSIVLNRQLVEQLFHRIVTRGEESWTIPKRPPPIRV
jgi:hypothetical protein